MKNVRPFTSYPDDDEPDSVTSSAATASAKK
jgi:hypothetical protein